MLRSLPLSQNNFVLSLGISVSFVRTDETRHDTHISENVRAPSL
jgi:hypothetical protein